MKLPSSIDPSHVSFSTTPQVEQSVVSILRPLGLIADSTCIEFGTGSHSDVVIDPQSIQLMVKIKVTDALDKPLVEFVDANQFLMAANNMLNSLFSAISVKCNGLQVFSSNHHNFISYIRTLVNTTSDYRSSILRAGGWYEMTKVADTTSTAALEFKTAFDLSREVILTGPLDCPFFRSGKFLPPGTDLTISLTRATTEQFLVSNVTTGFRLHLLDAELSVRFIRPEPQLQAALNEAMLLTPYLYGYKHIDTRAITLPSGIAAYSAPNLHIGRMPSTLLFTFIDSDSFKGNLKTSPYMFTGATLNAFSFSLNGVKIPVADLKFNTSNKEECIPLFNYVNGQLALNKPGPTPGLTLAKFQDPFFFVAQNFLKDVSASALSSPGRGGSLSLDVSFKTALTTSHTLLVMSEFSKTVLSFNLDGTITSQQ
jgi:hypothetical protein